ncbi:hypothetical protein GYMLUDRAFT_245625 [Collybiopsis luxurians FD-317 M1]|uniref:Uncharacterized protein n=1 Tax=Collybiopsis luxurians FD-317 M1 TaxID=944289 RepID=A0A0D0CL18_9AGAR|nr:hypothetical protein GYMLUDRAFT_245625 [Collybiopsis luxurians FD-317 M1]
MIFTSFRAIAQILTEDIIQMASSSIVWMTTTALVTLVILRYVWFPCLSLQKLHTTIRDVGNLLEGYEQNIRSQCLSDTIDYDQHKRSFKDFEDQLLRIKRVAHKRSDKDYKAACWKKYFSFSRAAIISSSYKRLLELKTDIEHSNVLILDDKNDHLLQPTRLHHRKVSSAPEEDR